MAREMAAARRNRRTHAALGAAALVGALGQGCGDSTVVYRAPDAAPWGEACTGWDTPDGGVALVTNSLMNSLSVIDLGARRVSDPLPVPVTPLAENGPHHLALDPAQGVVYMPLSFPAPAILPGPHAEHGSASVPGVFIKRSLCDMRLLGRVDVDANPGDMLLSPDRRRAYVSHFDLRRAQENPTDPARQRGTVVVIDTASMTRVETIPVCVAPHGMVLSPDGNTLYLACYGDDAIGVVDLTQRPARVRLAYITGAPPSSVTSPTHGPYSIGIAPDGNTVWTGCTESGALLAYDVTTGQIDAARVTRRLAGKPFFPEVSRDGATMLVPTQGRDELVRMTTRAPLEIVQRVSFAREDCVLPHQVSRGPDGLVYLVCEGVHGRTMTEPGTVLALDPDTLAIRHRYAVGTYPDAIVFHAPGGAR
jgi:hypothetical protein